MSERKCAMDAQTICVCSATLRVLVILVSRRIFIVLKRRPVFISLAARAFDMSPVSVAMASSMRSNGIPLIKTEGGNEGVGEGEGWGVLGACVTMKRHRTGKSYCNLRNDNPPPAHRT